MAFLDVGDKLLDRVFLGSETADIEITKQDLYRRGSDIEFADLGL
jgi:hypothetical protein